MTRTEMILCIGKEYHTSNIEGGEYSYVQEAGSRAKLEKAVGHPVDHFKLDIRFELNDIVVLIETKQSFVEKDELQLAEYVEEELALHKGKKIVAILANTNNDEIKVWKNAVDDEHVLNNELEKNDKPRKEVKLAVLLPVSAAIGTSTIIENEKIEMLKNNTLEVYHG